MERGPSQATLQGAPHPRSVIQTAHLLFQTLDALPAHLITPFNGFIPPSNLLDKIARGVSAAKGPNDWPHSIRATRIKLLELARSMAQEERRRDVTRERSVPLGQLVWQGDTYRARTPDPAEVLQLRTNTPIHARRPLYRQSSMDFLDPDKSDRSESIARYVHLSSFVAFHHLISAVMLTNSRAHIVSQLVFSVMIACCTILIPDRRILAIGPSTTDLLRPLLVRPLSTRIAIPEFVSRPSRQPLLRLLRSGPPCQFPLRSAHLLFAVLLLSP